MHKGKGGLQEQGGRPVLFPGWLGQAGLRRVRCDRARRVLHTAVRFWVRERIAGILIALVPQGVRDCKVGTGQCLI